MHTPSAHSCSGGATATTTTAESIWSHPGVVHAVWSWFSKLTVEERMQAIAVEDPLWIRLYLLLFNQDLKFRKKDRTGFYPVKREKVYRLYQRLQRRETSKPTGSINSGSGSSSFNSSSSYSALGGASFAVSGHHHDKDELDAVERMGEEPLLEEGGLPGRKRGASEADEEEEDDDDDDEDDDGFLAEMKSSAPGESADPQTASRRAGDVLQRHVRLCTVASPLDTLTLCGSLVDDPMALHRLLCTVTNNAFLSKPMTISAIKAILNNPPSSGANSAVATQPAEAPWLHNRPFSEVYPLRDLLVNRMEVALWCSFYRSIQPQTPQKGGGPSSSTTSSSAPPRCCISFRAFQEKAARLVAFSEKLDDDPGRQVALFDGLRVAQKLLVMGTSKNGRSRAHVNAQVMENLLFVPIRWAYKDEGAGVRRALERVQAACADCVASELLADETSTMMTATDQEGGAGGVGGATRSKAKKSKKKRRRAAVEGGVGGIGGQQQQPLAGGQQQQHQQPSTHQQQQQQQQQSQRSRDSAPAPESCEQAFHEDEEGDKERVLTSPSATTNDGPEAVSSVLPGSAASVKTTALFVEGSQEEEPVVVLVKQEEEGKGKDDGSGEQRRLRGRRAGDDDEEEGVDADDDVNDDDEEEEEFWEQVGPKGSRSKGRRGSRESSVITTTTMTPVSSSAPRRTSSSPSASSSSSSPPGVVVVAGRRESRHASPAPSSCGVGALSSSSSSCSSESHAERMGGEGERVVRRTKTVTRRGSAAVAASKPSSPSPLVHHRETEEEEDEDDDREGNTSSSSSSSSSSLSSPGKVVTMTPVGGRKAAGVGDGGGKPSIRVAADHQQHRCRRGSKSKEAAPAAVAVGTAVMINSTALEDRVAVDDDAMDAGGGLSSGGDGSTTCPSSSSSTCSSEEGGCSSSAAVGAAAVPPPPSTPLVIGDNKKQSKKATATTTGAASTTITTHAEEEEGVNGGGEQASLSPSSLPSSCITRATSAPQPHISPLLSSSSSSSLTSSPAPSPPHLSPQLLAASFPTRTSSCQDLTHQQPPPPPPPPRQHHHHHHPRKCRTPRASSSSTRPAALDLSYMDNGTATTSMMMVRPLMPSPGGGLRSEQVEKHRRIRDARDHAVRAADFRRGGGGAGGGGHHHHPHHHHHHVVVAAEPSTATLEQQARMIEFAKDMEAMRRLLTKNVDTFMEKREAEMKTQRAQRKLVVDEISKIVKGLWCSARVELYGSCFTGLDLPSSDVDVVVCDLPTSARSKGPASHPSSPEESHHHHHRSAPSVASSKAGDGGDDGGDVASSSSQQPGTPQAAKKGEDNDDEEGHNTTTRSGGDGGAPAATPTSSSSSAAACLSPRSSEMEQLSACGSVFFLHQLAAALEGKPWVRSMKTIDTAFIPVIKLYADPALLGAEPCGLVPVDISLEGPHHGGMASSLFIRDMIKPGGPYTQAVPLTLLLKTLMNQRGLNMPWGGGLSSYALMLMVITLLQQFETPDVAEANMWAIRQSVDDIRRKLGTTSIVPSRHSGHHHHLAPPSSSQAPPISTTTTTKVVNKNPGGGGSSTGGAGRSKTPPKADASFRLWSHFSALGHGALPPPSSHPAPLTTTGTAAPPLLAPPPPPLLLPPSIGFLLTFFLDYYGRIFNPATEGIAVDRGFGLTFPLGPPGALSADPLTIVDPLDETVNVSRCCFRIGEIQWIFSQCLQLLELKGTEMARKKPAAAAAVIADTDATAMMAGGKEAGGVGAVGEDDKATAEAINILGLIMSY